MQYQITRRGAAVGHGRAVTPRHDSGVAGAGANHHEAGALADRAENGGRVQRSRWDDRLSPERRSSLAEDFS